MQKLKDFLDSYILEFDWKDIAIFKLCMAAFGVMVGVSLPSHQKRAICVISGSVFIATAIVLCARLFGMDCPFCAEEDTDEDWDDEEDEDGFVMKITTEE